jgi:hypothetical protein
MHREHDERDYEGRNIPGDRIADDDQAAKALKPMPIAQ